MKKHILLLLLIAFTATSHAQQHIKQYIIHIYPTGNSDKPIDEVVIKLGDSTFVQSHDFKAVILTDSATMHNVIAYTLANATRHRFPVRDFGGFGIVLYKQTSQVKRYYLISSTESKTYLAHFIAMLDAKHADQQVTDELQKLFNRVND